MAPKRARSKSVSKAAAKAPRQPSAATSHSRPARQSGLAPGSPAEEAGGELSSATSEQAVPTACLVAAASSDLTQMPQSAPSAASGNDARPSAFPKDFSRMLVERVEHLLQNLLSDADGGGRVDHRVLEIAVLDARQLGDVDAVLLADAERCLAEALAREAAAERGTKFEEPEVLLERVFDAINDGDTATVEACLDANADTPLQLDVDAEDDDGSTPLSEAACYGERELVEMLLRRRAHPDRQNRFGRTPLWRACYNGHLSVIELLLKSGADKEIANYVGEEPGKYGTPESKDAVIRWDPAETLEIRARLGLTAVKQPCASLNSKRSSSLTMPIGGSCSSLGEHGGREDLARRFTDQTTLGTTCPVYPIKVALRELHVALLTAHHFDKVPLVICNGLDHPDRFLMYSCECLVDAKQILAEIYVHKTKSLAEIHEELRQRLLATMETHGVGLGLHIRMGDSACDFKGTFCTPGMFPTEVFGGSSRWNDDVVRLHFGPLTIIQPDFRIVVSTTFSMEDAMQHLPKALPFFEDMAFIEIDSGPLL